MHAPAPNNSGQRPDLRALVWRYGQTLPDTTHGLATGFDALDRVLPQRGWMADGLNELIGNEQGIGEFSLVLPALAAVCAERKCVLLANPPFLPYAPALTASASLTFDHPSGVLLRLDGLHVGEQFADNFETRAGSANGRVGLIPAYRVYGFSARYRLPMLSDLSVSAAVKNVAGNKYIASRRPEGIKPGLPRTVFAGVEWRL